MTQTMYSTDGVDFTLHTISEVYDMLDKSNTLKEETVYFYAFCEKRRPGDFNLADDVIETLLVEVFEQAGTAADVDVESIDQAAKDKLNAILNGWANEFLNIAQYWRPVHDAIPIHISADDVEIFYGLAQPKWTEAEDGPGSPQGQDDDAFSDAIAAGLHRRAGVGLDLATGRSPSNRPE